MATREQGIRRTAVWTASLAAAAVLGSVGVGVAAYAQDQASSPADTSTTGNSSSSYPSVDSTSGRVAADARSGGS